MGVVFDGYLSVGGVEVMNIARAVQYAMGAGRKPARMTVEPWGPDILPQMLGVARYSTPEVDGAPWATPLHPESWGFAGLVPVAIDLGGNFSRPLVENTGDGGNLGRLRAGTLAVHVTAVLVGATCCSVGYGMRWLTQTLMRDAWCVEDDTAGVDLTFLACAPSPDELYIEDGDDLSDPDTIAEVAACAARYFRTAHGAALIAPPTIVSRQGGGCGRCAGAGSIVVEWTMAARLPWLYAPPEVVLAAAALNAPDEAGWPFTWVQVDPATGLESTPCDPPSAAFDPLCIALPPAPTPPPIGDPCSCSPVTSARLVRDLPANIFGADLVVSVTAGADPVRNVLVQVVDNPDGVAADLLPSCAATAGLLVSYVPAGGTLTVDGARREATLTSAAGAAEPGDALISASDGGPYQWPVAGCGPATLIVDGPPNSGPGALVSVSTVRREPA